MSDCGCPDLPCREPGCPDCGAVVECVTFAAAGRRLRELEAFAGRLVCGWPADACPPAAAHVVLTQPPQSEIDAPLMWLVPERWDGPTSATATSSLDASLFIMRPWTTPDDGVVTAAIAEARRQTMGRMLDDPAIVATIVGALPCSCAAFPQGVDIRRAERVWWGGIAAGWRLTLTLR